MIPIKSVKLVISLSCLYGAFFKGLGRLVNAHCVPKGIQTLLGVVGTCGEQIVETTGNQDVPEAGIVTNSTGWTRFWDGFSLYPATCMKAS